MWSVGGKDRIKVDRGVMKKNMAKGFVSSGILAVFLLFIYFASFLFGQFMDELVLRVWGFIKLFFTMFPMYMTIWLTSLEVSADIQTLVAAIVYVVTLISCVVGAGIGYIVGFKRIPIIQPWLDKWKRN